MRHGERAMSLAEAPDAETSVDGPGAAGPYPSSAAAWYAVFVLLLMFMLSFTDRQIIALLVEPLHKDLGLTDLQLSLLQGFAFGLLNVFAGLFLGWATDRLSRRLLILGGVIAWSISCTMSGLARGFGDLFVGRVGIGVGEAALGPAAGSMLSDLFPREKLTLALGVFTLGANLGITLSFTLGGVIIGLLAGRVYHLPGLGVLHAWQLTFILVGLPGLLLWPLLLTLPEPARRGRLTRDGRFLKPLLGLLARWPKLFACHFVGFSLNSVLGFAMMGWAPALLTRHYGWAPAMIGPALGITIGVCGISGSISGGLIADHFFRRGVHDIHFRLQAIYYALMVPLAALLWLAPTAPAFLATFGAIYFLSASSVPQGATALQLVAPNELRGRLSSSAGLVGSILGFSGPVLVALITQKVLHDRGAVATSVGLVVGASAALGVLCMLIGRRTYGEAVRQMNRLVAGGS
jgi:MFS family permease